MICPKCEAEYVKGIKICVDCDIELIPREEFEKNLLNPSDWVIAYTTSNALEAQMLKSNLNGADIDVNLLNQNDRNFPTEGDFSVVKLFVKKTDAAQAVNIINDILNSEDADN